MPPRSRLSTYFLTGTLYTVLVIAALLFIPGLPPASVRYEAFKNTRPTEFPTNNILDKAEIFVGPSGGFEGPESIAIRGDDLYTGVNGGRILKIDKDRQVTTVATIGGDCRDSLWEVGIKCGRPLGMRFDSTGKLIVADAYFGLFRIDVNNGKTEHLLSTDKEIDGKESRLPDDLDIGSTGEIYWSDASTVSGLHNSIIEYMGSGSGRVLKFDLVTKTTTVLMDKLHFPNGVQLSPNEDFLLVAETMRARVWKYYLKGSKKGQRDIFIDGLPGAPDNIRSNGRDGFYIALVLPRDAQNPIFTDDLGPLPLVRKLILRIYGVIDLVLSIIHGVFPSSPEVHFLRTYVGHLGPIGDPVNIPKQIRILEVSTEGQVIRVLQSQESLMRAVTEASVGKDYTYFGSYSEPNIWRISNKILNSN